MKTVVSTGPLVFVSSISGTGSVSVIA